MSLQNAGNCASGDRHVSFLQDVCDLVATSPGVLPPEFDYRVPQLLRGLIGIVRSVGSVGESLDSSLLETVHPLVQRWQGRVERLTDVQDLLAVHQPGTDHLVTLDHEVVSPRRPRPLLWLHAITHPVGPIVIVL